MSQTQKEGDRHPRGEGQRCRMTMDPKRGGHTLRERDRGAEMGGQTHNEDSRELGEGNTGSH